MNTHTHTEHSHTKLIMRNVWNANVEYDFAFASKFTSETCNRAVDICRYTEDSFAPKSQYNVCSFATQIKQICHQNCLQFYRWLEKTLLPVSVCVQWQIILCKCIYRISISLQFWLIEILRFWNVRSLIHFTLLVLNSQSLPNIGDMYAFVHIMHQNKRAKYFQYTICKQHTHTHKINTTNLVQYMYVRQNIIFDQLSQMTFPNG